MARVEQEIAAVGPVKGARLDQAKVGDEGPLLRKVLDGPRQIAQCRVRLLDDGDLAGLGLADQHVHFVPVERTAQDHLGHGPALTAGDEHRHIVHQVRLHPIEMSQDRGGVPKV